MPRISTLQPRLRTLDTRTAQPAPKRADPFYLSPEWRDLMRDIYAKRGRRCEVCGRSGCRVLGDHIIELRDGGARLDERNVRVTCWPCHTKKTNQERAKRYAKETSDQRS